MRFMTLSAAAMALGATLLAAAPAEAQRQPPTQEELQARLDAKKALPWLTKADWTTDFDEAKKRAEESGKVIFAYFTRSYAK